MARGNGRLRKIIEHSLPWLVLVILLTYSYAKFFQHPYGFGWDPDGTVYIVFTPEPPPTLLVGDRLLRVGSLSWDTFRSDLTETFFQGVQPGQTVPVVVERDHQTLTIPWTLPGINQGEVLEQLFSEWFLAYAFWLVGTLVLLFVRPKDERWWLLIAFNYLTAIWLSAGSGLSNYHIWYSALVLRMTVWLCVPVYLHLHWIFPRPIGKLSLLVLSVAYLAVLGLMVAQWFQLLPADLYFLGFLLALLGSFVLLVLHAIRQPDSRQELRIIWVAVSFALIPLLAIAAVDFLSGPTRAYSLALLSFPALPLAYLYAASRHQLGGLEVRVNRLISIYLFLILLATLGIPLTALADRLLPSPDATFLVAAAAGAAATLASLLGFPGFQSLVERHWLGIALPAKQLPQIYSGRAKVSTSIGALLDMLRKDILPSLLVREFVFLRLDTPKPEVALRLGLPEAEVVPEPALAMLQALPAAALLSPPPDLLRQVSWVRLALPLRVSDRLLGYWLFGRRDPDDYYSQHEIPILQSLADQTAITLSNIVQTGRLHAAYQDNIQRFEQERLRLALELHDGILNRMAALLMRLDDRSLTPAFQDAYNDLAHHLREIVKDLRPAMLDQGLVAALEELVDNLSERTDGKVNFQLDVKGDGCRYPSTFEQHLFRIVQEACTNAVRHANPSNIRIYGSTEADRVELEIQDDGAGFDMQGKLNPDILQANHHFGLMGMLERAELIGATLHLDSTPGVGTRITVIWTSTSKQPA